MARRGSDFQTIRSEGGLLPQDLLRRVLDPKESLPGTAPEDYGLPPGERPNEAITQSWNRLSRHWAEFRAGAARLGPDEPGTGLTNDKWSLPLLRELGFGLLPTSPGPEVNGRTYPISRFSGPTPIHLVGCGVSLDRRAAGVRGAAAGNPHGLVQEFLNRSEGHLWAIVGNGLRLRVLRDSQTLSRQSYLEFDLEAMFVGEAYADFVLLWMLAHATRFAPRDGGRPETCWLEEWTKQAEEQGTRALGDLRAGVEKAIEILGQGFVGHPRNTALRELLRSGRLPLGEFHGQLLRVVYRLIFLFVAEDRRLEGVPALHPRDDSEAGRLARERYAQHYGTGRLRELAASIRGSRHGDLWQQFNVLTGALAGEERFAAARAQLALPVLGSFFWAPSSTADLNASSLTGGGGAELANADFLEAVRNLAFTHRGKVLRPVDYRNLGSEELGSVYEGLLTLTPQISGDGARFTFAEFAGNVRKTSGSYYTPDSLVQCLLDSALNPVVEEAIRGKVGAEAEQALLDLKVCDPAVGSGHFLVGAAHRLARHLARVRAFTQGESEPSPLLYQQALRDVIGRCLYGVDLNPMAAELCRVSLWLEALEPGKPLSFLDHHIRVGNSLLGATPELIAGGIPDEAYEPVAGDDKKVCSGLKKRNRKEREGQQDMLHLMVSEPRAEYLDLAQQAAAIDGVDDATAGGIQERQSRFERMLDSEKFRHAKLAADAWCAAFVWRKTTARGLPACITTDGIRRFSADAGALSQAEVSEVASLSEQYRFFHWHLAFPEVFAKGGFDGVLGNPPWERVKLQEAEWFAQYRPDIAMAPNAAVRKSLIGALAAEDPGLFAAFRAAIRSSETESAYLRHSGRYPLCGRGDINAYAVFAETFYNIAGPMSGCGLVVPSGILADDTTKLFFRQIHDTQALAQAIDFENNETLFPGVGHGRMRFCLLTIRKGCQTKAARMLFLARGLADLQEGERWFELEPGDTVAINPNSGTCPVFLSRRDAEISKAIYRRFPVLRRECPAESAWGVQLHRLFDMTTDASLFKTTQELVRGGWQRKGHEFRRGPETMLPVVEGKMVMFYDHRAAHIRLNPSAPTRQQQKEDASDSEKESPSFFPEAYLWAPKAEAQARFHEGAHRDWAIAFKRVTSATNWRTMVACVVPDTLAISYTLYVVEVAEAGQANQHCLLAMLNSFAYDYFVRQKTMQPSLPIGPVHETVMPPPASFDTPTRWFDEAPLREWIAPRVVELTCVSNSLVVFGRAMLRTEAVFRWNVERRALLQAELDAMAFHHFGMARPEVEHVLSTFPKVREYDVQTHGDFRTSRVILEIFDAMAEAMRTGQPYQTRLDPPPADPRCCHPPRGEGVS